MREDWEEAEFGQVANYLNGRGFKKTEWEESGLPIIRIQNLNNDNASFNYTNELFEDRYSVKNGDLLFSWAASLGVYIWKGGDAWLNQHIFKVVPKSFITKSFLYYSLSWVINILYSKAHGSGMVHITKSKFQETELKLPPLPEQRAIVARIEELFSELDNGISNLKKAQEQLKVYRQAVLKKAFEGEFESIELKELADITGGVTKGKKYKNHKLFSRPYLRVANVQDGYLDLDVIKEISITDIEFEKYVLEYEDVLFTEGGDKDKLGRGTVWKNEVPGCIHQNHIFRARVNKDKLNPYFLSYYASSPIGKDYFFKNGKQTTNLASINKTILSSLPIPNISLEDQAGIVGEIESHLSVCDKLERIIGESLEKAEALRQSILKKAFAGELLTEQELEACRQEPDWEPAEKLLERIKSGDIVKPSRIAARNKPAKKPMSTTDKHAALIAKVVRLHEETPKHHDKLSHVKCEKIAHLVEYHIGIDLGRKPVKDAAGPDDYRHLKKVESRAKKAGFFYEEKLKIGHTYHSGRQASTIINKFESTLETKKQKELNQLIETFLPFDLARAEVVATIYAGWNNLLLDGKSPSDEEIVTESRENWSKRKLRIPRENFFKTIQWMRNHDLVPKGVGLKVDKK